MKRCTQRLKFTYVDMTFSSVGIYPDSEQKAMGYSDWSTRDKYYLESTGLFMLSQRYLLKTNNYTTV